VPAVEGRRRRIPVGSPPSDGAVSPRSDDPLFRLVGLFNPALLPDGNGFPSSDHRLVAADLRIGHGH
jgi:hypothetical protein